MLFLKFNSFIHKQGCIDTPSWKSTDGLDCEAFRKLRVCENGGPKPGDYAHFGIENNYPEKNCCGCGKFGRYTKTFDSCTISQKNCRKK